MMLFILAWRNIWRSKKRSLIIGISLVIGLWAGIFIVAFYNGMIEQRLKTGIQQEISHIQIHAPHFTEEHEVQYVLNKGNETLAHIQKMDSVKSATGRVVIYGMVSNARGNTGIKINGILPESESKVTLLDQRIREGSYLIHPDKNEILISKRLSEKLNARLKSKIILTFQDKEGTLASAAFRVCGLYESVNSSYDEMNVFVHVNQLDSLAGIAHELHEIAILLNSSTLVDSVLSNLQLTFPDMDIKNWKEISPELGLTSSVTNQMIFIYMGIILLALSFGIINTMLMSVLERTSEIGMLRALGMSTSRVFTMIIMETFFLVVSASPLGIACALLTVGHFGSAGISLQKYKEVYANFGYSDTIYPLLFPGQLLTIVILLISTAFISALIPSVKAIRLNVLKSIRN